MTWGKCVQFANGAEATARDVYDTISKLTCFADMNNARTIGKTVVLISDLVKRNSVQR